MPRPNLYDEAAEALGIPRETVKRLCHEAAWGVRRPDMSAEHRAFLIGVQIGASLMQGAARRGRI